MDQARSDISRGCAGHGRSACGVAGQTHQVGCALPGRRRSRQHCSLIGAISRRATQAADYCRQPCRGKRHDWCFVCGKGAADGYTLLLDATSYTVNPSLFPKLNYDPAKDLAPVSLIVQVPLLMVVPMNSPYATVADVVKAAKATPGKLMYASAGTGGAQHLAAELLAQNEKISMTHIPYKGGAPALTDLIGGQVDFMFSATTASGAFVKGGKLKPLAITSSKRLETWPQVPTVIESGIKGFEVNEWNGLFAPAGTPRPILDHLEAETRAVVASPAVQGVRFAEMGVQGVGSSSKDFAAFVKSETAKWAGVIKAGNS